MVERPSLDEVERAAGRLSGVVADTGLVKLHSYDASSDILLKPEIHQPVTSFKIRGVFNAVAQLSAEARSKGLCTVSAGNTAQALAWCGRHFGVPSRSVMPDHAPETKIAAVRRYGGEPVLVPVGEVFRYLQEHLWEREPYAFVHPWTNRDVMIGHGTMGLEIAQDLPDVDTVFLPVGGGGLMGGVGSVLKALRPTIRIVAVEPEGCPALHESLRNGKPTTVACDTSCDGVAVPYITDEVFPLLSDIVDDCVLVSEETVRATIRRVALGNRMIVEGSAALSVAAAIATPAERRGRTVAVVTGGSIDTPKLVEALSEHAP
jgi:threonine dehydratase